MKKIRLITHNDLDGVSCGVLASIAASSRWDSLTMTFCSYDTVDKEIEEYLDYVSSDVQECGKAANHVLYITDISMVKSVIAEKINKMVQRGDMECVFIDHHKLSIMYSNYTWTYFNEAYCGTMGLFFYLISHGYPDLATKAICRFVCDVNDYDMWLHEKNGNKNAKDLNSMMYMLGADTFVDYMHDVLLRKKDIPYNVFDDEVAFCFLEGQKENDTKYIKNKVEKARETTICGHSAYVTFAERLQSQIGNDMCKKYDCDIAVIISMPDKVSLRSEKEEIDLCRIAKQLGGGGHQLASGFQMDQLPMEKILEMTGLDKVIGETDDKQ